MKNLFVLDPIHAEAVAALRADASVRTVTWDDEDIANWKEKADAVIVRARPLSGEEIRAACRLKVIGRHGAGYDKVDITAVKERGIALIVTPFENSQSVAELAVALMLSAARMIPAAASAVKSGGWNAAKKQFVGNELAEKKAGFVGFGRIAQKTADMLRSAFAMEIYAYDPFLNAGQWKALPGATPCASLEELFAVCDYVSLHAPKTPETQNMINKAVLSHAKKGLILINTARGGLVNEQDLLDALRSGTLAAAASDVLSQEPAGADHPLLACENFIATPHFGGSTADCTRKVALAVVRETVAALSGKENKAYRVA